MPIYTHVLKPFSPLGLLIQRQLRQPFGDHTGVFRT